MSATRSDVEAIARGLVPTLQAILDRVKALEVAVEALREKGGERT